MMMPQFKDFVMGNSASLLLFLMKFKTQKSVTDKITSNNLNSMGFNRFLLRSTFGLLFIHGYIEGHYSFHSFPVVD
jgi:hypothetical protein